MKEEQSLIQLGSNVLSGSKREKRSLWKIKILKWGFIWVGL